jgi:hypothetical protein
MLAPALRQCRGNLSAVARMAGVTRQAVHRYVHAHPALLEVLVECRDTMLDAAETVIEDAILSRDIGACHWYLARLGKSRGYVERQEHSGPEGGPITITSVEAVLPPD